VGDPRDLRGTPLRIHGIRGIFASNDRGLISPVLGGRSVAAGSYKRDAGEVNKPRRS